jgi:hypothetical protein
LPAITKFAEITELKLNAVSLRKDITMKIGSALQRGKHKRFILTNKVGSI